MFPYDKAALGVMSRLPASCGLTLPGVLVTWAISGCSHQPGSEGLAETLKGFFWSLSAFASWLYLVNWRSHFTSR